MALPRCWESTQLNALSEILYMYVVYDVHLFACGGSGRVKRDVEALI